MNLSFDQGQEAKWSQFGSSRQTGRLLSTWPEIDRDNSLADVVTLGLWNRLLKQ